MLQIVDLKEDHIDELIKYHTLEKSECMIFNVMNELIECLSHDPTHLLDIQFVPFAPCDLHRPNDFKIFEGTERLLSAVINSRT